MHSRDIIGYMYVKGGLKNRSMLMHGRHNKVYYYILDIQQLQPRFMYDNCEVNDSYV